MKLLIRNKNLSAVLCALTSACLFALCIPFAKLLSNHVPTVTMGGLLYLGAGFGLFLTFLLKHSDSELSLTKKEIPYSICMIILDICAIIFLMLGISKTTGANASLIGNFELAATVIFAFLIFKEKISKNLFISILLITLASIILTFEGYGSFIFNIGSFFVLLSCICWGLENNFTRLLSIKDTRQITIIKGIFSGLGGLIISLIIGEVFPSTKWVLLTMLLGFFSYGVSVCLYIYAQRFLGASKTGAIYSLAPYFGVVFSLIILKEKPLLQFYTALIIMIIATFLVIRDTKSS